MLEPACQLDFRVKSDVSLVSAWEKEKKRERKTLPAVASAAVRGHVSCHVRPLGRDGEPAGRDLGHCQGWAMVGASPPGAPELIPSFPDPFTLALTHTCPSLTCLRFPVCYCPVCTRFPEGWLTRTPSWHGSGETDNPWDGAQSAAGTEKSQSSNSQQTGQPDSGLCFQSGFLHIFAITLASFCDVALALGSQFQEGVWFWFAVLLSCFWEPCGTQTLAAGWENLCASQGGNPVVASPRPVLTCFAAWLLRGLLCSAKVSVLHPACHAMAACSCSKPQVRIKWIIWGSLHLHRTLFIRSLHHSASCSLKWFLKRGKVRTSNGEEEYVIIESRFTWRHQTRQQSEPSARQAEFLRKAGIPRSLHGLFVNPEIFLRSLFYPEQGCVLFAHCFLETTGRQLTGR